MTTAVCTCCNLPVQGLFARGSARARRKLQASGPGFVAPDAAGSGHAGSVGAVGAEATTALLAEKLRLSPELAAKTYAAVVDPKFGETPDAKLDVEGLRNVLAIRAEFTGAWGGTAPPIDKYVELGPYERGIARLR